MLIDGFKITELLHREHPAEFRTLNEIAIPSEYLDHPHGTHLMGAARYSG